MYCFFYLGYATLQQRMNLSIECKIFKAMKGLLKLMWILLAMVSLASCDWNDDDGYSLNDFWVDFGLVESGDNGVGFKIHVDDGYAIIPVNADQINYEKYTNDVRVIANYTVIGDVVTEGDEEVYYAKINSLEKVLYKGVFDITPEKEDSIGNDPIHVKNVWKVGHMLNFHLHYWGASEIHYINLVKEAGEITEDDLPLELELRHNNRDDNKYYQMSAYVTFDLRSIEVEGRDSVNYIVRATDFDGTEFTYEGVHKY